MKNRFLLLLTAAFLMCAFEVTAQNSTKKVDVDLEELAAKLVNECIGIQQNEIVLVAGNINNLELLENIAVNVRKKGAFPLLQIGTERLTKRMYYDIPEDYDAQEPLLDLKLIDMISAQISISSLQSPDLLADFPPERLAKRDAAYKPVMEIYQKKEIRSVDLGNGFYPTPARAEQLNVSLDKLSEIFWKGVAVDYEKLSEKGKQLKTMLKEGKKLVITNKNGTDFSVDITDRKSFINDGIISAEDHAASFAGNMVFLPAGEVYLAPVPGTANGKIVVDNFRVMNKEVNKLELDFKDGKLVSYKAGSGLEHFKKYYEQPAEGKDVFAFVDFGINPNVEIPADSKLRVWMPAGMVTVGIGNNVWAGGENNSMSNFAFFLPGSTVTLDGKPVVEKGVLK